jgi:hypothetical protein
MSRLTTDSKQVSLLRLAGRTVAALSLTFLLVGCGGVQSPDESEEHGKVDQTESQPDETEPIKWELGVHDEHEGGLNGKDSASLGDEDTEVSAL